MTFATRNLFESDRVESNLENTSAFELLGWTIFQCASILPTHLVS
ncbi:MAG: hypothetical protein ACI87E_002113 [Mariniblastus sp.]|jgi:hypothetical protein